MKKKTKGLVALGASAALLAGTAGTFALWYDTQAIGIANNDIATGDLRLAGDGDGTWHWRNVSNETHVGKVGTAIAASTKLVPGDAVKFVWDEDAITLTRTGDTLVANLYLEGHKVTPASIYPLQVFVGGNQITTAANDPISIPITDGAITLPEIYVGFPVNATPVAPSAADSNAYGRNLTSVPIGGGDGLQIRLQQQVDGNYFGASN